MNTHTEAEMNRRACPLAKLFMAAADGRCLLHECVLFRQGDSIGDFVGAVQRAAEELGDTSGPKAKAAKAVVAGPEKYGLQRGYYCALGGKP